MNVNDVVTAGILFDGDGDVYVAIALAAVLIGLIVSLFTRRGTQVREHPRGPERPR